jgi:hypothetical protein
LAFQIVDARHLVGWQADVRDLHNASALVLPMAAGGADHTAGQKDWSTSSESLPPAPQRLRTQTTAVST